MTHHEMDWGKLNAILDKRKGEPWSLIPVLQDIQEAFNHIPPESLEMIAQALRLFPSQVQGVVSFYAGFSLEPKGKYVVKVCCGTACHVKGGRSVLRFMKRELGLQEGETSADYRFTLDTVACLGACFLAPVMMINLTHFGKLSPPKIQSILDEYQERPKESGKK